MNHLNVEAATPKEYLEYLQLVSIGGSEALDDYMLKQQTIDNLKEMEKWIEESDISETEKIRLKEELLEPTKLFQATTTPTKFDSSGTKGMFVLINSIAEEVVVNAKALDFTLDEDVILGTIYTREVNAFTLRVPSGGSLVVINEGAFYFIHLFAKVVSACFPVKKNESAPIYLSINPTDINDQISNNHDISSRFLDMLFAYFIRGDPYFAQQYFQSGPQKMITDHLRDVAELFIIAHEYSHIFLGHNDNSVTTNNLIGNINVNKYRRNWGKELEADNLAALLTIRIGFQRKLNLSNIIAGLDFFFSIIDLFEKILNIELSETHPPATVRRQEIQQSLLDSDFPPEGVKAALHLGQTIQDVIDKIWEKNKAIFNNLYQRAAISPSESISLY